MKTEDLFFKTLQYFQQNNPDLVVSYHNIFDEFKKYKLLASSDFNAIKKLTLISQYIYIDFDSFLKTAICKNEVNPVVDHLFELSKIRVSFGQIFINNYHKMNYSISNIKMDTETIYKNVFSGIKNCEKIISYMYNFSNENDFKFVLRSFGSVAEFAPGLLDEMIKLIQEKLISYPASVFYEWLERSSNLISSNRVEEGTAYLRLQSLDSRRLLDLQYVSINDYKNVISVYCSSIIGKSINILSCEYSSYKITSAYTNGKTIYLPSTIDYFKDSNDNYRAYSAIAAHISASIVMKTYSFKLGNINFREDLQSRYGTQLPNILDNVRQQYKGIAEGIKEKRTGEIVVNLDNGKKILVLETSLEKYFYSFPTPHFMKELFTLIENCRIEYALSQKYGGLKEDFEMLDAYMWEKRKLIIAKDDSVDNQMTVVLESLIQYSLTKKIKTKITNNKSAMIFNSLVKIFNDNFTPEMTVYDSAKIAFSIYNVFYDNFNIVTYCRNYDICEIFRDLNKPVYFPEVILEDSPELLDDDIRKKEEVIDSDNEEKKNIDLSSSRNNNNKHDQMKKSINEGSLKIYQYPEYNYSKGSYQQKYCTLYENHLKSGDNLYYRKILKDNILLHKKLKKRFLMLQPDEMEISKKWLMGDEINLDDAFDYCTSILRKDTADEKIYFKKIRNIRDVAVSVLIDSSSSTEEVVNNRTILQIEKESLTLLSSSLSSIGDNFGIFSFYSAGRNRVVFNIIKDFKEEWNAETQGRINSISAYASNRDGCAIRHAATKLSDEPEKNKLLLLLSDGIPADVEYGSTDSFNTSRYAIEDTRRAIKEAQLIGITSYCITIDKYAKQYIPFLYGDYNYTIINDIIKLPEKLSKLYLRLTR